MDTHFWDHLPEANSNLKPNQEGERNRVHEQDGKCGRYAGPNVKTHTGVRDTDDDGGQLGPQPGGGIGHFGVSHQTGRGGCHTSTIRPLHPRGNRIYSQPRDGTSHQQSSVTQQGGGGTSWAHREIVHGQIPGVNPCTPLRRLRSQSQEDEGAILAGSEDQSGDPEKYPPYRNNANATTQRCRTPPSTVSKVQRLFQNHHILDACGRERPIAATSNPIHGVTLGRKQTSHELETMFPASKPVKQSSYGGIPEPAAKEINGKQVMCGGATYLGSGSAKSRMMTSMTGGFVNKTLAKRIMKIEHVILHLEASTPLRFLNEIEVLAGFNDRSENSKKNKGRGDSFTSIYDQLIPIMLSITSVEIEEMRNKIREQNLKVVESFPRLLHEVTTLASEVQNDLNNTILQRQPSLLQTVSCWADAERDIRCLLNKKYLSIPGNSLFKDCGEQTIEQQPAPQVIDKSRDSEMDQPDSPHSEKGNSGEDSPMDECDKQDLLGSTAVPPTDGGKRSVAVDMAMAREYRNDVPLASIPMDVDVGRYMERLNAATAKYRNSTLKQSVTPAMNPTQLPAGVEGAQNQSLPLLLQSALTTTTLPAKRKLNNPFPSRAVRLPRFVSRAMRRYERHWSMEGDNVESYKHERSYSPASKRRKLSFPLSSSPFKGHGDARPGNDDHKGDDCESIEDPDIGHTYDTVGCKDSPYFGKAPPLFPKSTFKNALQCSSRGMEMAPTDVNSQKKESPVEHNNLHGDLSTETSCAQLKSASECVGTLSLSTCLPTPESSEDSTDTLNQGFTVAKSSNSSPDCTDSADEDGVLIERLFFLAENKVTLLKEPWSKEAPQHRMDSSSPCSAEANQLTEMKGMLDPSNPEASIHSASTLPAKMRKSAKHGKEVAGDTPLSILPYLPSCSGDTGESNKGEESNSLMQQGGFNTKNLGNKLMTARAVLENATNRTMEANGWAPQSPRKRARTIIHIDSPEYQSEESESNLDSELVLPSFSQQDDLSSSDAAQDPNNSIADEPDGLMTRNTTTNSSSESLLMASNTAITSFCEVPVDTLVSPADITAKKLSNQAHSLSIPNTARLSNQESLDSDVQWSPISFSDFCGYDEEGWPVESDKHQESGPSETAINPGTAKTAECNSTHPSTRKNTNNLFGYSCTAASKKAACQAPGFHEGGNEANKSTVDDAVLNRGRATVDRKRETEASNSHRFRLTNIEYDRVLHKIPKCQSAFQLQLNTHSRNFIFIDENGRGFQNSGPIPSLAVHCIAGAHPDTWARTFRQVTKDASHPVVLNARKVLIFPGMTCCKLNTGNLIRMLKATLAAGSKLFPRATFIVSSLPTAHHLSDIENQRVVTFNTSLEKMVYATNLEIVKRMKLRAYKCLPSCTIDWIQNDAIAHPYMPASGYQPVRWSTTTCNKFLQHWSSVME